VIVQTERKYSLEVGGFPVTAKIDRIDRHEGTGAKRVLDYKTSDDAKSPARAHAQTLRSAGDSPQFSRFAIAGKEMAWVDLQLPIYREAILRAEGTGPAGVPVALGYFNLPKAVGETGLDLWTEYTPELHASAMACAEGVAAGVSAGRFWPPSESDKGDSSSGFAGLFHQGVAASVDPAFAEELSRR
jgi:ATP-dependent helicase/nuclease subunit B